MNDGHHDGTSRGAKWNTDSWVTRTGGRSTTPASTDATHDPAATTTTSASSLPPKWVTRTRSPIGSMPNTGVSKWNAAPWRCACSIMAMRAAPDAIRPPPAWNTTVPSKRMPGQRSAATAGVRSSVGTFSSSSAATTSATLAGSPTSIDPVATISPTPACSSRSRQSASASRQRRTQNVSG